MNHYGGCILGLARHGLSVHKTLPIVTLSLLGAGYASAATIQFIVDNDFAVYAGTDSSITRSVYQNPSHWTQQISDAQSFDRF